MKQKLKTFIRVIVMCVAIFWCGRIYSINSNCEDNVDIYMNGESIDISGLELSCMDADIYDVSEYKLCFGVDYVNVLSPDDKIICVCVNVKNISDSNLTWDYVLQSMLGGFETVTWGSAIDFSAIQDVNEFDGEGLKSGDEKKIWCQTNLSQVSFNKHTWKDVEEEEFYYVPVIEPVKIMMKLNLK